MILTLVFCLVLRTAAANDQAIIEIDLDELLEAEQAPTWRVDHDVTVEITVSSSQPAELHLHGYDLTVEASPDQAGVLIFEARVAGRFPLTSHGHNGEHHRPLAYLEVYPD